MDTSGIPKESELLSDIDDCKLSPGRCAIWWLGQQSFIVKLGRKVLYLDPYLSPSPARQVAPLLEACQVRNADLIFGSHDHSDHIDRRAWPAIAEASPRARFVVPDLLREKLAGSLGIPLERLVGLDDGKSVELEGLRVTGIAAAHELLRPDEATGRHPFLGYVIEGNGCCVYHAGDTCLYEGLQTKLKKWKIDVAMLPINGRDAKRLRSGCIGNMTYQEAADLAGAIQPRLTIPAHYDMFASNSEDPSLFSDYMAVKYPHLQVLVCRYGRRVEAGA